MEGKNFGWSISQSVRRVSDDIITIATFLYMLRKMDLFFMMYFKSTQGKHRGHFNIIMMNLSSTSQQYHKISLLIQKCLSWITSKCIQHVRA